MSEKEFVKTIHQTVVLEGLDHYKNNLNKFTPSDIEKMSEKNDPHWKKALKMYHSIPEEHKENLLVFLDLVIKETVTSTLGILDNTHTQKGYDLTVKDTHEKINGDLQELFLVYLEDGDFID